ncbi:nucleotide-binding universal stress UspA family protein [Kribbella rubisoli]|uniref:Nucleotide-binding universal stress UspA family protein n=1 Tax=Kribbella rubisoli TaxID=3075929 RepID=A0A4Q7WN11_9ACTN|nr:universal stress protein [Kribbella rubisoli]RZU10955.1 nucleotide-binding universal stress UspA family protein [Kribbella rubisoli]
MTMIVGYASDERGKAALHLAGMLARSAADDLIVCTVVPAPWVPGMARVDAEYQDFLAQSADQALERARNFLPDDVPATYVRHSARSAPAGLLELAEQNHARLIVLGSSSAGAFGHIALGSVTDRLLHSSHVSLALATRGFRCPADRKVSRVTAAFGGTETAEDLVLAAASVSAEVNASLRIATFAVWARPAYTTRLGTDSEDLVMQEWRSELDKTVTATLSQVQDLPEHPRSVETVIGSGTTWSEAIDEIGWEAGDVLVIGSSELGPVARVFLGSRATKILRHSPVPVLVIPHRRAEELAERAEHGTED